MTTSDGRRNPRSTTATKVPGIPKIPTKISAELRQYLTSLGEALEIRLGRKGDPRDRAVTLRELTDGDLSSTTLRVGGVTTTGPAGDGGGGGTGTVETPVAPTGFLVTGGFSYISLRWNWPGQSYSGHSLTEIWRNTVDDRTEAGGNQRIGISPGTTFIDRVGSDASFYYWIRHVNVNGQAGPFNAVAGTLGETQPDVTYLLNLLAGSIGESELNQALTTTIDDIETTVADLETTFGSTSSAAASALAAQNSASAAAADAAATAADVIATAADVLATAADVIAAGGSASFAATSATNAASSANAANTAASNASSSETSAAASATNALGSASLASTSATNAAASESNASQSASNASSSETSAAGSASNAAGSASAAATSATNAANSASLASASEGNAYTSEQAAAASESNAAGSESAAALSATAAAGSASNASQSAANAASSATQAATSESNAAGSASSASSSATNAAASESNASQSEANAASSETSAATSESNAAGSASGAATSATNAAASANAANTSAGNAATSETAAAGSATNAAGSASIAQSESSNAASSATQAAGSATAAQTSASGAASSASAAAASATASAYNFNQITARLDDVSGNSSGVTIEEAYQVTATNQDDITDLEGQYTIKIDTGGTVAGFGLASSSNTFSGSSSEFYVRADRFAVLPATTVSNGSFPTTNLYAGRTVYRSDLDETYYYDADNTQWSTTLNHLPFAVITSPTTLQGETVPAGVYIDTAFMNKGRVLDLIAGSVVADFISVNVAMDAPALFGGTINVGQINKPTTDPRTWTVTGNTRVSNFSVDALGVMHANSAVMEGITIKAPDGTVLVDAGGMTGSSGGNLVYNANFRRGELTFNENTSTWTEDTTDIDGFVNYSGTVLERNDLGYIRAGDNSTGQGYVRSNKQRFPVVAGETLYLYAQTSTLSGLWMAVAYYDNSNGTTTSGYVSQTAVSNSNSDFDSKSITAGGASRRSSIAAITVPASAQYGEIRFGSDTGDYVYYYNVGVSRTPPEIAPKYAATYIRDLSVDTLQIAGNAVTVPIGVDDINIGDWVTYSGVSTDTGIGTNWGLAAHTGSAGGQTAVPLSWDDADKAPEAINLIGCINVLGQSGSAHKTVRVRLIRSTSPTFSSNVTQVQQVGGSQRTDFSATYSLNATIDVSAASLQPNTNYYFGLQVHANDQVNSTAPYKIGANGLTVLAAKK